MLVLGASPSAAETAFRPVIVLSREVRPYLLAADALAQALDRPVPRLYVEDGPARLEAALFAIPEAQRALVAIGPEAVEWATRMDPVPLTVALMVVDPPVPWPPSAPPPASIVLHIPLEDQIRRLHQVFPDLEAVAVGVSSQTMGAVFSRTLSALGRSDSLRLIPIPLADPPHWESFFHEAASAGARAVLFLPHPGLASTAVIRFLTGQAILRRLLPVGYNRAFLDAGAAAFIADPEGAGREAASLLKDPRLGKEVVTRIAPYRLVLRQGIVRHLGLGLAHPLPEGSVLE